MVYHILFINESIFLYVGFYGFYTSYGFFFVDRSPSCWYSIPINIIIEVIFGELFFRKYNCRISMLGWRWLFSKSSAMFFR